LTSHHGPELIRDAKGNPVIDCEDCGFAHLWPKPTPEELAEYYAESFYESGFPDWHEKEAKELPYWQIEFADRLATLAEMLKKPVGKLLDIGCGGGWFLSYAAAQGWDVLGIEPSRSTWNLAVTRAPVLLGTFPEVDVSQKAPFDAVHLKLVMEHVSDALEVLCAVHKVLRPGGAVVVQSPNDFNPLQLAARKLLDKDPWWVVHPVHINYFNFDSLERTLRRCGFQPYLRDATFPMEWFLLQGIDYIGRDDIGRKCHGQRMALEQNLEATGLTHLRRGFSRWLASQGIGREVVIYAVRK
jgi:SAM-dependent methyltransferase